ncbi:MAG TPA: VOC family protein [Micromonosporaceae bacterium]|jgi:hypothetical protein
MIGRIYSVVLDTPDPRGLAAFYAQLLGLQVKYEDGEWADIGPAEGDERTLSFQLAPNLREPRWPDPDHPQQFHVDVLIAGGIEEAEKGALELGATKLADGEGKFRVYADPSGHPFCLCWE